MRDDSIVQRVKLPTQVMVWSVMSVFGTGRLYIVQGNMKQEQYKIVLEQRLIPQLCEWARAKGFTGTGDFVFMHDGAPCHRGRQVTTFLEDLALRYCRGREIART